MGPGRAQAGRQRAAAACLVIPAGSRHGVVPAPAAGEYGRVLSRVAAAAAPVMTRPQTVAAVMTRPEAAVGDRVMTPVPAGRCRRAPTRVPAVAARVMTPALAGRCRRAPAGGRAVAARVMTPAPAG